MANESVMKGNVRLTKETFGQKLAFLEIAYTPTHICASMTKIVDISRAGIM